MSAKHSRTKRFPVSYISGFFFVPHLFSFLINLFKDLIPRQQFKVAIQAAIGGKIIARETVASFRKDVTQKLYGGDVTRKNKLLDKQKKGKKRMRQFGKVDISFPIYHQPRRL